MREKRIGGDADGQLKRQGEPLKLFKRTTPGRLVDGRGLFDVGVEVKVVICFF